MAGGRRGGARLMQVSVIIPVRNAAATIAAKPQMLTPDRNLALSPGHVPKLGSPCSGIEWNVQASLPSCTSNARTSPEPPGPLPSWTWLPMMIRFLYMIGGDDDPVVTKGYDSKILDAAQLFPDGIGMVYGHMANASFSRAVAPTSRSESW